jgi:phosphopantothenoylcysteine decarboxylase / phosphopantothenate---cysteine ligase
MRFLVTAGPTREAIDPVRYISNRSSGKMGYALAQAARERNHQVTLISGPVCISPPAGVTVVRVTTSDEMYDAVHSAIDSADVAVLAAAVADFKPANVQREKIKKSNGIPQITLVPTRDILASLGAVNRNCMLIGFAAETQALVANAQKKLREKKCDIIIANSVSGTNSAFDSDDNELNLFFRNGETQQLARASKIFLARKLVRILENFAEKR